MMYTLKEQDHFLDGHNIELSCPAESATAKPSNRSTDGLQTNQRLHFRGQLQRFVSAPLLALVRTGHRSFSFINELCLNSMLRDVSTFRG